ncbi:MAG: hypothetical protein HY534_08075 [Chloroflexi bacterium]|nr:hypothetical protein [Chloroflexota bacterium]
MKLVRLPILIIAALAAALVAASPALASHSWNGYHWATTSSPFTLQLVDSVTAGWDSYLGATSTDWSVSSVLDTAVIAGATDSQTRRKCPAPSGQVRVCNQTYGFNGWLGVAQVWVDAARHIAKGATKLNDSYFNTATYNRPEWKQMVMCQEVGHTFGLGHQDENFDNPNLGTCMDYTRNPLGPPANLHPNQHDYDQLVAIYNHLDSRSTVKTTSSLAGSAPSEGGDTPAQWGQPIRRDAHGTPILYRRDLGGGQHLFTWVIWIRGGGPPAR